jgi:electron transfer flavoprotein beta subunit
MTRTSPSVAVLVSAGFNPVSSVSRACRGDVIAMALGHQLAGDTVRVIHAGDPDDDGLRDYLAFGAASIEVLPVFSGLDPLTALIETSLNDVKVILTGSRAERSEGSGLFPYLLAKALDRPIIAGVLDAHVVADGVVLQQFLPKGQRRRIAAPFPVVLAIHPRAPVNASYAYARRVTGKIDRMPAVKFVPTSPVWTVEATPRLPVRLMASDTRSGHERMLNHIETPARGGAVVFDGSPVDKAQILLNYLREHRLVDF